jgi:hypothetical protein
MKYQSRLRQLFFSSVLVLIGTLYLAAQQTGSPPATGDPQALVIVESSLAALSGASSWSNVQASHLTGTMSLPSKNGPTRFSIEWEDIWKQRKIWYLHKMGTGNSERDLVQSPGRGKMLRREDKSLAKVGASATLPPVEIPGAFLSVILEDSTCSIQSVSSAQNEAGNEAKSDVVRITCAAPQAPGGVESQVWTFSHSTHMPESVSVVRQDLRRAGVRTAEVVYFKHYRMVDGLAIPDTCELTRGGMTRTVSLQIIEFPNPSQFPKSDFEVTK